MYNEKKRGLSIYWWILIILLIIVLGFLVYYFGFRAAVTGKVVYNEPLTLKQLAEGVKLDKQRNIIIWTNDINYEVPIEEAFASILKGIKQVYSINKGKYWFPDTPDNKRMISNLKKRNKWLDSIKPGNKYKINLNQDEVLTYIINKETTIILPDGSKVFPGGDEIICVNNKGIVSEEVGEEKECESRAREINEGELKKFSGFIIKVINADENGQEISSEIEVYGGLSGELLYNIILTNKKPSLKFNIENLNFKIKLISASDTAATIMVTVCGEDVCIDGDDGLDYSVKGIIKCGETISTDYCDVTPHTLNEFFIGEDGIGSRVKVYYCPYGCNDGACVGELSTKNCVDTDGGNKPEVKGEIQCGSTSHKDFCLLPSSSDPTRYHLAEYYLSKDEIEVDPVKCPSPTVCKDGACV